MSKTESKQQKTGFRHKIEGKPASQKSKRWAWFFCKPWLWLVIVACLLVMSWFGATRLIKISTSQSLYTLPTIESGVESVQRLDPAYSTIIPAASGVAEDLVRRFPEDSRALHLAGQLYFRFGMSAEATQLWRLCLQLNPTDFDSRMALATLLFESGAFEPAEEMLLIAYEQNRVPSVAYLLANTRLNQGRLVQAEELLTSSLMELPDSFPNLVLLGQVLLQLKRPELARQRFLAAADLAPNNANVWFGIASACELLGQSEEAATYRKKFNDLQQLQLRAEVEQARQHDAGVAFRQELAADCFLIGRFYLEKGDSAEAQKHWQLALQLNPGDINACFSLARLYLEQGQRSQSLNVLSSLSQHTSTDVNFWIQLGQAFSRLEAFEHADEAYRRIVELYPDSALGYAARCELRIRLGRPSDDTIELARHAVQRQPIAANQFLLSVASHQAGDNDTAIRAIHEAMRLEPQNLQYQQWNFSLQN